MRKYSNEEYAAYMSKFQNADIDANQKIILRLCFLYGLDMEIIEIIGNMTLDYQHMDFIRMAAVEGVGVETLKDMAENPQHMQDIKEKYYEKRYVPMPPKSDYNADDAYKLMMESMRKMKTNQEELLREIRYLEKNINCIKCEIPNKSHKGVTTWIKEKLFKKRRLFEETELITLISDSRFSNAQVEIIMSGRKAGLSIQQIRKYACFDKTPDQMERIKQLICEERDDG